MHSKKESILKRWHSLTVNPKRCASTWAGKFWQEDVPGFHSIRCAECRSFNHEKRDCSIKFGTPLRKCVVSSIEAHFNNCEKKSCLEIGFGRFMLARNLIRRSGGIWTGIEPKINPSKAPKVGHSCHGTASEIPFPEATFDIAFGIQSIVHWGQKIHGITPSKYDDCFREIHRILKPGGTIYFDAPIHFHGHEMFIMGDIPRIRNILDDSLWENVVIEKWREDHAPLENYPPPPAILSADWAAEIESYPDAEVNALKQRASVYMIAITAQKKPAS